MFHVILFEPEIPPNTGNIIRLCANTGCHLHLIEPLGFVWDDKRVRRAGLDYHELANISSHASLEKCLLTIPGKTYAFTTKGKTPYHQAEFLPGDALLFGPETRGLPQTILSQYSASQMLFLPQQPKSRSLNLSNCVSIAVYEAWRQNSFITSSSS